MSTALVNSPVIPDSSVVAENAPTHQVVAEILTAHGFSYNTDRSGVEFVVCRCGKELRIDGPARCIDLTRTLAAHQAEALAPVIAALAGASR